MAEIPANGGSPPGESGLENGLTPIHRRIHCAATDDIAGTGNELEVIDIENFLDTIAEIAMAAVRRRQLRQ